MLMTGGACPIKTSMHIYYDHADLLGSKHSVQSTSFSYTHFFYKNNFIRAKALVLAKKLRASYVAVPQNIPTKCLG